MGLKILLHSLKLIFRNWKVAVRISSPLLILLIVSPVIFGADYLHTQGANSLEFGQIVTSMIPGLLQIFVGIWVAVAWHRYVLLAEDSGSIIPKFGGTQVASYFVQGLKILLLLFVASILVIILFAFLGGFIGGEQIVGFLGIAIAFAAFWAFYRVSPVLPAAALGLSASIVGAWKVTKGLSVAILILVLALGAFNFILAFVIEPIQHVSNLAYMLLSSVQIWISVMLGISVLTTIYGVAVENREL